MFWKYRDPEKPKQKIEGPQYYLNFKSFFLGADLGVYKVSLGISEGGHKYNESEVPNISIIKRKRAMSTR